MASKYSFYQLKVACQQHVMASLYVDPEDPDAFNAGYVEAVTPRHVLLWSVTPWGQPDGWLLRRTEDVLQVFMGDDYEIRLQMLLQMGGYAYAPLLAPQPGDDDDLMALTLQHALQNKLVVSLITSEDTYTGRLLHVDDLRVTLELFDFFGGLEGEKQFTLRELETVAMETNEEKMYQRLHEERPRLL